MVRAPLREIGRPLGCAPCRDEHLVLRLVPVDRGLVHMVPGELVEDEQRREPRELVERRSQRIDVMEDTPGYNCVERPWIVELLQRDLPVERAFRSMRIDRQHVVAGGRQRRSDAALAATTDLEDPPWRLP